MAKSDTHLLINKNGDCLVYDESPMEDRFVSSHILNTPYISFPLNHIITKFIGREHLYELDVRPNTLELTEAEKRVLTLIRKGNISTLSVKFKSDRIDLIETEEDVNVKDVKGRLVDLIQQGGYQEISYKTVKGKIVSLKRRTKHK